MYRLKTLPEAVTAVWKIALRPESAPASSGGVLRYGAGAPTQDEGESLGRTPSPLILSSLPQAGVSKDARLRSVEDGLSEVKGRLGLVERFILARTEAAAAEAPAE